MNTFKKFGYDNEEINSRIENIWFEIFEGPNKFYFENGDFAYIVDTGNDDVRTEGMSYGMLMAVLYDRQDVFDKLWNWTMKYMYMDYGIHEHYFAWSVDPSGKKNAEGPAPDGEEFFAFALLMASNLWGDKEGIYNYSYRARELLKYCLHKGTKYPGHSMWNLENKYIKFVPEVEFTDPSYHTPHFYEIFSLYSYEEDSKFWKEAATESRLFLEKALHPETGLSAEYSDYDGNPMLDTEHPHFYSDSYRTVLNVTIDTLWNGGNEELLKRLERHQNFFMNNDIDAIYSIDGEFISKPILHPVGLVATIASTAAAIPEYKHSKYWIDRFWNTPLREDDRRYYDNFLYAFSFLALSGKYKYFLREER